MKFVASLFLVAVTMLFSGCQSPVNPNLWRPLPESIELKSDLNVKVPRYGYVQVPKGRYVFCYANKGSYYYANDSAEVVFTEDHWFTPEPKVTKGRGGIELSKRRDVVIIYQLLSCNQMLDQVRANAGINALSQLAFEMMLVDSGDTDGYYRMSKALVEGKERAALVFSGNLGEPIEAYAKLQAQLRYPMPAEGEKCGSVVRTDFPGAADGKKCKAWVLGVDGLYVAESPGKGQYPLRLTEGAHSLTVEFSDGRYSAQTVLSLTVQAGEEYALKADYDGGFLKETSSCEFVILNVKTGAEVTPKQSVKTTYEPGGLLPIGTRGQPPAQ